MLAYLGIYILACLIPCKYIRQYTRGYMFIIIIVMYFIKLCQNAESTIFKSM